MRVALIILLFLSSCSSIRHDTMTSQSWPKTTWHKDISSMFNKAVVFYAHGNDVNGRWVARLKSGVLMPVEHIVRVLREEHPDHQIVLLVCNPGGYEIHTKHVSYARTNVWVVPDSMLSHPHLHIARELIRGNAAGGLDEFVHN